MAESSHKKFNFWRADYDSINDDLSQTDWNFIHDLSIDDATTKFYETIFKIISDHTPLYRVKKKYPPWFSNDIKSILRKKN